MLDQGYEMGDCLVQMPDGSQERACAATLQRLDGVFWRLIKSAHLSRPEHYLSIYQSGCNSSCLKCHSHEFSQVYNGEWASTDILAGMAADYAQHVTEILRRNMVLEVLTVYIPGWVEIEEVRAIARRLADLEPTIPYTILCFFPAYRMQAVPSPTLEQMLNAYQVAREEGLVNVKLGNCGHFAQTPEDFDRLVATVGIAGIG